MPPTDNPATPTTANPTTPTAGAATTPVEPAAADASAAPSVGASPTEPSPTSGATPATPIADPTPGISASQAAPIAHPSAGQHASTSSSTSSVGTVPHQPQAEPAPPDTDDASDAEAKGLAIKTGPNSKLTIGGYVEAFYSYNFNRPSNGITHYRTFDNRHNAITLQNLALDFGWDSKHALAKVVLQAGHAPNTYYGVSEPDMPGADGTVGSNAELWRYVQQAYIGWHLPVKVPITLEAGVFLSPLGPEGLATHENWTWSHTPLFYALPFYHAGARLHIQVSEKHDLRFGIYNGWNNIVDNNPQKSLAAEYTYTPSDRLLYNIVYFTGAERPPDAAIEGGWRHTVDTYLIGKPSPHVALLARAVAGIEPTTVGNAWWLAGSLGVRVQLAKWLYLSSVGTLLREQQAGDDERGFSSSIFYPTPWMAAATGTADFRPGDHLSIKLEFRHDQAGELLYFAGDVAGEGTTDDPYVPNQTGQNTLTLGLTAWF